MSIFNTEHKRKSATITTVIMILLLVLMIFFGMNYLDPPEESGIAVNFGNTDVGSGNSMAKELPKPNTETQETEAVPEEQPETNSQDTATEEVVTQNNEEAIALKKAEAAKKKIAEDAKKAKAEADRIAKEKREAEEKAQKERDKKKADLDAMMNGMNNSDGKENEGEGPNDGEGNKGNPNGSPYANTYYGAPGVGDGGTGGYGLNGRGNLSKSKVQPNCNNTYGTIVINIDVDRSGKVVDAKQNLTGSTSTETCLIEAAIKTAKSYRWSEIDAKGPSIQKGFIVVKFTPN